LRNETEDTAEYDCVVQVRRDLVTAIGVPTSVILIAD
jgi:hypothetical protein